MKDRDFFEKSGGGVTISGGEPMTQFDALLGFVKKAKESGLHVCLDTCGYASTENYNIMFTSLFQHVYAILTDLLTPSAANTIFS